MNNQLTFIMWEPGTIIWAKTNKKHWPAIILSEGSIKQVTRNNHVWVFWFGDYRMSEIKKSGMLEFHALFVNRDRRYFKGCGIRWRTGLYEAINAYGHPNTIGWDNDRLLNWALDGFKGHIGNEKAIPEFVLEKLHTLLNSKANSPLQSVKNNAIILKEKGTENACLGCYSKNVIGVHPLFHGRICKYCKERIFSTIFLIGDDNINFCCTICGNYGKMVVCSVPVCSRCLDNLFSLKQRKLLLKNDFWICFVCKPSIAGSESLIRRRDDWRESLNLLYTNDMHPTPRIMISKRPIRVLSLFDGISSGLVALKKINVAIEAYFASEVDPMAINVSQDVHSSDIEYLGDVKNISEHVLREICPIDLLIGGSPCNDLSLVNPDRKGLIDTSGTGILFFEYYRILMALKRTNERPFFWLFENVASMSPDSKSTISCFFESDPVKINSAWVSPQHRERYFWGNCPSLCMNFESEGPKLQEYLGEGRKALVEKIGTVTTRSNSLLQGRKLEHPVLNADSEPDMLTSSELEQIFGFAPDYTRVPGANDTSRQKLIGRAWSVQVATMLLHFLKYYYTVNYE